MRAWKRSLPRSPIRPGVSATRTCCRGSERTRLEWHFEKRFHVSPFMPMAQRYLWRLSAPEQSLTCTCRTLKGGVAVFDATLSLKREPISSASLARALLAFPLLTLQILAMIHWEALTPCNQTHSVFRPPLSLRAIRARRRCSPRSGAAAAPGTA